MSSGTLRQGLAALGFGSAAELLEHFLAELERWNARFGFVKATADELVAKHVLDSIAAAPVIAGLCTGGGVLDVGSGAGFPGIPLAIALPGVRFSLLERSAKKCAFLENSRALLGLGNVRVLQADLAAASGRFDVVTFRAVAPLERFFRELSRSAVAWGAVAAYKGRRDRVDAELEAIGAAARGAEVVRLEVPFMEEERHLVVVRNPVNRLGS